MLSWATESLLVDGRAQSDIRQGVTLEVMGEGWSMGPLNDAMKKEMVEQQGDIKYDIAWTTLGEYLDQSWPSGISPNVASFVGATTVRVHELGYADRPPTPEELARMRKLVDQAMEEGALGVGSSLIYAPAFYAETDELVALCEEAAKYGGMYISHMRSEGDRLLEAVDELIEISRRAKLPAEIYHLKAAGKENWGKLDAVIAKVEDARAAGLKITADMYTYTAGATGLDAAMPPWVQEGGLEAWVERLKDPAIRAKVAKEMATPTDAWENFFVAAGPGEDPARRLQERHAQAPDRQDPGRGRQDARQVARGDGDGPGDRGRQPRRHRLLPDVRGERPTPDRPPLGELRLRRRGARDRRACSSSPTPPARLRQLRPRPRQVRARREGDPARGGDPQAHHPAGRATSRSANAALLKAGYFADVVVFDPAKIQDHATFDKPHQYATGVGHVFVNGVQVLKDGEPTGAAAGRVVRGPGWKGWKSK